MLDVNAIVYMLTETTDATAMQAPLSPIPAANVAQVPQRSPLRYPGGKTWLIPHIRAWLGRMQERPAVLVEPFAGGGTVSLTAVIEGLVERSLMSEIDPDVSAFWQAALNHSDELILRVRQFEPTVKSVRALAQRTPASVVEHGFRTLVLNRTRRGGILADGASLTRFGENGKGIASRWYADTLIGRLREISKHAERIDFLATDGLHLLDEWLANRSLSNIAIFVDPPYNVGGKRAGRRLYNYNSLDHPRLFSILAGSSADFLMTYDECPEIIDLIGQHGFHAARVVMKNTHHAKMTELLITRQPVF